MLRTRGAGWACLLILVLGACGDAADEHPRAGASAAIPTEMRRDTAPAEAIQVGSRLVDHRTGELWATVLALDPSHRFGNGVMEPGVQVRYNDRRTGAIPPQWLPLRSARLYRVER